MEKTKLKMEEERRIWKILSIDGGGVRGIIPASFLKHLEDTIGKSIHEIFDLFVGTSTGGILCLGLTAPEPKTASEMLQLYSEEAKSIFPGGRLDWLGPKHPNEQLKGVLNSVFHKSKLSETKKPVMVTSYEINTRSPFLFKSWESATNEKRNFYLRDVALAASAAPTFFPPAQIWSIAEEGKKTKRMHHLVDGGVFANNPTLCALSEARKAAAEGRHRSEDEYLIVSLGTGNFKRGYRFEEASNWGKAQWALPIIDICFDGVAYSTHYQTKYLIEAREKQMGKEKGQSNYFRFQVDLDPPFDRMDDCSDDAINYLHSRSESLLADNADYIKNLVDKLKVKNTFGYGEAVV